MTLKTFIWLDHLRGVFWRVFKYDTLGAGNGSNARTHSLSLGRHITPLEKCFSFVYMRYITSLAKCSHSSICVTLCPWQSVLICLYGVTLRPWQSASSHLSIWRYITSSQNASHSSIWRYITSLAKCFSFVYMAFHYILGKVFSFVYMASYYFLWKVLPIRLYGVTLRS